MADDTTTSTEDVLGTDDAKAPEDKTTPQDVAGNTFTQADLDRLIADRLKREKQKYADYGELKRKAEKLETLEAEQLTEQEKLQKQVQELEGKLEKSDAEKLLTKRQNAILQEAAKANFTDPGDAFVQLMHEESVTIEDGKVTGAAEAVKQLAEAKPYLLKQSTGGNLEAFNPAGKARNPENDAQRISRLYGQTQGESPIG